MRYENLSVYYIIPQNNMAHANDQETGKANRLSTVGSPIFLTKLNTSNSVMESLNSTSTSYICRESTEKIIKTSTQ